MMLCLKRASIMSFGTTSIVVNGWYSPENCRWITLNEQQKNKRDTVYVEYKGERVRLQDLAREAVVNYDTLHNRIFALGWDVEAALSTPSQVETSFSKKCRDHGLNPTTVRDRIVKFGWSEERALNTPTVGRGATKHTYKTSNP